MSAISPLDPDGFALPTELAEFEGVVVSDPAAVEATKIVAQAAVLRTRETASAVEQLPREPRTVAWAVALVAGQASRADGFSIGRTRPGLR